MLLLTVNDATASAISYGLACCKQSEAKESAYALIANVRRLCMTHRKTPHELSQPSQIFNLSSFSHEIVRARAGSSHIAMGLQRLCPPLTALGLVSWVQTMD